METDFFNRNMFYGAKANTIRAASILRKNMTLAELILWGRLKDRKVFQAKFRRQHPVDIFIVDFYCHEYKLVIEIDGEIHNNENRRDFDLGRTAELKKFGIRVIRFTNEEVVYKIDQVVNRILKIITELTPL